MDTLTSASKSLLECSEKLEKNVVLLEECRADSSSIQSLAAGVNYYASTTKASQAAATANHKQLAWDWLSDPREKQPLKETLKSVRYQCECTSKAAYQVVEVSQEILSELKSHKETKTEQTRLLKLIAGNQVELSKLLKGTATTGGKGQAQPTAPATLASSGGTGPMPAAHAAPLGAPDTAPPGSPGMPQSWVAQNPLSHPTHRSSLLRPSDGGPITGKFWAYQPSVAPNYEPNESRNPPTAAYSGKKPQTRRGKCYMQLTATADLLRGVSPLPTPMIKRGRWMPSMPPVDGWNFHLVFIERTLDLWRCGDDLRWVSWPQVRASLGSCFYSFHRRSRPGVVTLKAFSNCDRCEWDNKGLDGFFFKRFFHIDPECTCSSELCPSVPLAHQKLEKSGQQPWSMDRGPETGGGVWTPTHGWPLRWSGTQSELEWAVAKCYHSWMKSQLVFEWTHLSRHAQGQVP